MRNDMADAQEVPVGVVGMDLGDRWSELCWLSPAGEVEETGRVATTAEGLRRRFAGLPRHRVVVESSTHSPWVSRQLAALGHEVLVANARRVQLIAKNTQKCDRVDAELLARLGRADPRLLSPVHHRSATTQTDLALIRSRDALVRSRTQLINHVRGTVKALGERLPRCSSASFARAVDAALPPALRPSLEPVLQQVAALTTAIGHLERRIEQRVATSYPEAQALTQPAGVGALTALCYVLTLEDPARFRTSRAAGAYVGLRPARRASSASDPECHITKAGDPLLRRLLVSSAQYILGPFAPESDLRTWGLALAARGRKNAKKRAVIAVARKLAVLLHHLWLTQEPYVPQRRARAIA